MADASFATIRQLIFIAKINVIIFTGKIIIIIVCNYVCTHSTDIHILPIVHCSAQRCCCLYFAGFSRATMCAYLKHIVSSVRIYQPTPAVQQCLHGLPNVTYVNCQVLCSTSALGKVGSFMESLQRLTCI